MNSGQTAIKNGKDFENKVETIINNITGYNSVVNSKATSKKDCLIRQYPFTSIYESNGRVDFRLDFSRKTYYIECKFQRVKGSVDEKLPYTLMNVQQHSGIKIIVIDGEGWRPGALKWLRDNKDEVLVFSLKEFEEYMYGEKPV